VGRLPGAATLSVLKESPAKPDCGKVETGEEMECGAEYPWSRLWQLSISAEFRTACRSSVTEMTGNRINTSTVRATSCIRRFVPVHRANCIQMQNITPASRTHARLRASSILRADSITGTYLGESNTPGSIALRVHIGVFEDLRSV
jgi:hypothetical protein